MRTPRWLQCHALAWGSDVRCNGFEHGGTPEEVWAVSRSVNLLLRVSKSAKVVGARENLPTRRAWREWGVKMGMKNGSGA